MLFFFSSRRRHTRLQGDWSSDVCSSDLRNPWQHAKQHSKPARNLSRSGQISPPQTIGQIVRHVSGRYVRVHHVRKSNRNNRHRKQNPRHLHPTFTSQEFQRRSRRQFRKLRKQSPSSRK